MKKRAPSHPTHTRPPLPASARLCAPSPQTNNTDTNKTPVDIHNRTHNRGGGPRNRDATARCRGEMRKKKRKGETFLFEKRERI